MLYHIGFRYGGLKFKKSLRTRDARTATARMHRVDENIRLVDSGRLAVPEEADLGAFLLSDGQLNGTKLARIKRKIRTLRQFSDAFLATIPDGALEPNTIRGMQTHLKHLRRVFGASFALPDIDLEDLQRYVERRSKDKGVRGKTLSAATIKKEITTLRTIWNWAKNAGHVARSLPLKGLRYPRENEKLPFQTLAEIERRIARSTLTEHEENELWSALFLTTTETEELLEHVGATARHLFLYPMFVFAAHTGARRSEILRSQLDDIDFAAGTVTIHKKKRVRGRLTTHSVPMSPLLRQVLRGLIPSHPGGLFTFALRTDEDAILNIDVALDEGRKRSNVRRFHIAGVTFRLQQYLVALSVAQSPINSPIARILAVASNSKPRLIEGTK